MPRRKRISSSSFDKVKYLPTDYRTGLEPKKACNFIEFIFNSTTGNLMSREKDRTSVFNVLVYHPIF